MKKVFLPLLAFGMLIACNSGSDSAATGENTTDTGDVVAEEPAVADITADPNYQKGLQVVAQSDCATCHDINKKLIGPAYNEVAQKYHPAADTTIDRLADKIINGGVGVWGQIPMTPHPQITKEDAVTAVKYILLLKDEK